jgi:SPP1 gp7 family putative phage head morphogenesis protein
MPGAPSSSLLGVNVFRSEPVLKPLAEGWVSENTSLIKSLPTRLHPELEGIVRRGVMNGQSVKDIKEQIKARYGVSDYRAKLIAQDQTLKLNADLTRYRLQSVGVERYVWRSVQDSRVRPEHADRNGNEYSWKEGAGGSHPGQEVRCRCRAEAVWGEED